MAKQKRKPKPAPEADVKKELVNARVEVPLIERARNAVWHVGRGRTLAGLVAAGLLKEVEALEKEHNGGEPFPQRTSELPKSSRKRKKPR